MGVIGCRSLLASDVEIRGWINRLRAGSYSWRRESATPAVAVIVIAPVGPIRPVVGHPDAVGAIDIVTLDIAPVAAAMVTAFDEPVAGHPGPDGDILPVTFVAAVVAIVDDDGGGTTVSVGVIVPAVIDGRGDNQAAKKATDDGETLVAGLGGLGREGQGGGGDKGESGDFVFHMSSKVGFTPWDEAPGGFIQYLRGRIQGRPKCLQGRRPSPAIYRPIRVPAEPPSPLPRDAPTHPPTPPV